MNIFPSLTRGLGRLRRQFGVLLGLLLLNVAFALPLTMVMSNLIEDSIGSSLFHQTMREGFDSDWYAEFANENEGLAKTFGPSIIGMGAIYNNLDDWWSGRIFSKDSLLLWLGLAYLVVWSFLLGGVIESARPDGVLGGIRGFLEACGRTFGRFFSLALLAGVFYYGIFRFSAWLFVRLEESLRNVTVETTAFRFTLVIAALTIVLLHLVRLVFDYAKIAVATEDHGVFRGLWRGCRFVLSRPFSTAGLYSSLGLLSLGLLGLYSLVAPGAGQSSTLAVLFALGISQLYLLGRITLRVALINAELNFFGGEEEA